MSRAADRMERAAKARSDIAYADACLRIVERMSASTEDRRRLIIRHLTAIMRDELAEHDRAIAEIARTPTEDPR